MANLNDVVTNQLPTLIGNVKTAVDAVESAVDGLETALSPGAGNLAKNEDTAHVSGDVGIMFLAVRKDALAALAADGDYLPVTMDQNGAIWVQLAGALSKDIDSIDVAKKSKGAVTTAHNAITGTATSAEIDCRGYNSLLIHWVSSATDKTWTIQVTGATGSGLTFVEWITSAGVSNLYTTDISGFFIVQGIPDYIKIVATEVDDGATVTCKVQPFNM